MNVNITSRKFSVDEIDGELATEQEATFGVAEMGDGRIGIIFRQEKIYPGTIYFWECRNKKEAVKKLVEIKAKLEMSANVRITETGIIDWVSIRTTCDQ